MADIALHSRVQRNQTITTAPLVDELVMLDLERDAYYGLDYIATHIWAQLEEPRAVSALCDQLQQEFDVDRETCERDVLELLQWLSDNKLVEVVGEDAPPT